MHRPWPQQRAWRHNVLLTKFPISPLLWFHTSFSISHWNSPDFPTKTKFLSSLFILCLLKPVSMLLTEKNSNYEQLEQNSIIFRSPFVVSVPQASLARVLKLNEDISLFSKIWLALNLTFYLYFFKQLTSCFLVLI